MNAQYGIVFPMRKFMSYVLFRLVSFSGETRIDYHRPSLAVHLAIRIVLKRVS